MRKLLYISILSIICISCNREQTSVQDEIVQERYVHKYGVDVPAEDWAERGQDGEVYTTLANGVNIKRTYAGGIQDGETTYSYPHSDQIEKHHTYSNGNLNKEIQYYISGAPQQQTTYLPGSRREVIVWYENGTPQSIETYEGNGLLLGQYFTKNNQLESSVENGEGTRTLRDYFGLLISGDKVVNGQVVARTTYYSNGLPKEIIPYQNGLVDGLKKTYQPDGAPTSIEQWHAGVQTGVTTQFKNGEKYADVPYVNGVKSGIEKRYKDESEVIEEITWVDDLRTGPSHTHVGETTKTDWYLKNRLVSQKEYELLKRG